MAQILDKRTPLQRVWEIATLTSRREKARRYENLDKRAQHYLASLLPPTRQVDTIRLLWDVLDYLAGAGIPTDLEWSVRQVIRYKKLPTRKAAQGSVFSSSMSPLESALLARDKLEALFTKALVEVKTARAKKVDPFAWGLKTTGHLELARQLQQASPILHALLGKERRINERIGGDDSHVDFSQFAAGYGATKRDVASLDKIPKVAPTWVRNGKRSPQSEGLLLQLIDKWEALGRPEMADAFTQGFVLAMIEHPGPTTANAATNRVR